MPEISAVEFIRDLKNLALEELSWCVFHLQNALWKGDRESQKFYEGEISIWKWLCRMIGVPRDEIEAAVRKGEEMAREQLEAELVVR